MLHMPMLQPIAAYFEGHTPAQNSSQTLYGLCAVRRYTPLNQHVSALTAPTRDTNINHTTLPLAFFLIFPRKKACFAGSFAPDRAVLRGNTAH